MFMYEHGTAYCNHRDQPTIHNESLGFSYYLCIPGELQLKQ